MSASNRLSRLLALVPWLMSHDGVSISDCAEHFGVTAEQLEQDLWLLVVCGVPGYGPDQLIDIDFWSDGRVHVLDAQTLARPLRLSSEESTTLLVALRMLAQLPGVDDRDALLSAAAKLEAATALGSDRFVAIDVSVAQPIREAVDAALVGNRELAIEYVSGTRDEVTERTIRPLRLITIDGVSYLEAYCLLAEAIRTFRLDRVLRSTVGEPFDPGSISQRSAEAQVPAQPRWTMSLLLEPSARWIIDVHHAREDRAPRADNRTLVEVPMHSADWAVRLVLSLRGAATVIAPRDVVEAVGLAAEAALAAYPSSVR